MTKDQPTYRIVKIPRLNTHRIQQKGLFGWRTFGWEANHQFKGFGYDWSPWRGTPQDFTSLSEARQALKGIITHKQKERLQRHTSSHGVLIEEYVDDITILGMEGGND